MPLSPPPLPGDRVGSYLLADALGVGGMATVYRATAADGRIVAVKILHPGKADTDDGRRFEREFLTLKELRHDNVVQVFEAGVHGDYPWIAMELVEGTDLGTMAERWTHDPPEDRWARVELLLRGLCAALSHVHERGLIHRDLKPSNVLVTFDGQPKLTDFGVVKAPGQFTTQLTMAGRLVGTIAFMAPEQISGEAIDSRADLYSLGAVLYQLLTGRKPIEADSVAGYLTRHLTHTPTPPHEVDPRVPVHLERICLRLLQKDPVQRFASARQVLAALDEDEGDAGPVLIGREDVLRPLLERIGRLEAGAGGVVVLTGPEGSGKSAILAELVRRARSVGHEVAWADGAAAQPVRSLCAQMPVRGPDDEDLTDPGLDLEERTAGRAWTLVVDHLDQLSDGERAMLTGVLRQRVAIEGERLLLVGAARTARGRASGLVSGARTGLSSELLPVGPLSADAVAAMLRARGLGGGAGAILGRRLADETHGLPGPVLEQLDALVEAGWLVREGSGDALSRRVSLDELREAPLPVSDRLRAREQARLTDLPDEARRLLEAAAVLGADAPLPLVARIAELSPTDAPRAADALAAAGLVAQGDGARLSLPDERLRSGVYSAMRPARRQALHRAAAAALRRRSRRRDGLSDHVLRHLIHGGQLAEAFPMLLRMGRHRLASGQLDAADRLVQQARGIQEAAEAVLGPAEVGRLRRQLFSLAAEVAARRGELTGALDAWEQAREASVADGDRDGELRARAGKGLVHAARGDADAALKGLGEAARRLPPGDPMWPRVAQALAEAHLWRGETGEAAATWQRLVEVARAVGKDAAVARAQAGLALCALVDGDLASGREGLVRCTTRLRVLEADATLAPVLLHLAHLLLADGQLLDARERAREAEACADRAGLALVRIEAYGLTAQALAAAGSEGEARQVARDGVEIARARGAADQLPVRAALLPLARALLDVGLHAEVRPLLRADVPRTIRVLDAPSTAFVAVRARSEAWQDPRAAAALAETAAAMPMPRLPWLTARVRLDIAQALLRAARASRTPALQERAAEAVRAARETARCEGLRLYALEAEQLALRVGLPHVRADTLRDQAARLDVEAGAGGRLAARFAPPA